MLAFQSSPSLKIKLLTATRDMTAASGDVAYTGVGFLPRGIILIGGRITSGSIAPVDQNGDSQTFQIYDAGASVNADIVSGSAVWITSDASGYTNRQSAAIKTLDADGFTLTWTKYGSPTGTGNIMALCFGLS